MPQIWLCSQLPVRIISLTSFKFQKSELSKIPILHLSITLTFKCEKVFLSMFLKVFTLPTLQQTFWNFLKVWSISLGRKVKRKFYLYQIGLQMFYFTAIFRSIKLSSFLNSKTTLNINKLISNKVPSNKKCACIYRTLQEEKYKRNKGKFKKVLNCTFTTIGETAIVANSIITVINMIIKPHYI